MKKKTLTVLQWLIPVALAVAGGFLYSNIPTSFLGLACFGLAGLLCLYYLIALLTRREPMVGKLLRTVLSSIVTLGVVVVVITGSFVAKEMPGRPDMATDYIVVLGAKVNGTAPSRILLQRIDAAESYLKANPNAVAVLSGGQGPDEGISEAQCMFNELSARGIDPDRLWMEDKSTSTWENLTFSLDLIGERAGERPYLIGLVSSEFHLYRAGQFARDCGVLAAGIPAHTDNPVHFVNYFLREIAGIWHYILLGG